MLRERLEEPVRVEVIRSVQPLGEPRANGREELVRLGRPLLLQHVVRVRARRAPLEPPRPLLPRDAERLLVVRLRPLERRLYLLVQLRLEPL